MGAVDVFSPSFPHSVCDIRPVGCRYVYEKAGEIDRIAVTHR